MSRRARLVGELWRWHRRAGLLAAIFLLLMSVSGILLNHVEDLALDQRFVAAGWLRAAYGDTDRSITAYRAGDSWLAGDESGKVLLDTRELAPCEGGLRGALALDQLLLVACARELRLLDASGELVDSARGLPGTIERVGSAQGAPVIAVAGRWLLVDTDTMHIGAELPAGAPVTASTAATPPADLRAALTGRSSWLNWERLLLDLHSGRLFGRAGVWVVDIAGVLLSLLALSGVTMWWLHRKH